MRATWPALHAQLVRSTQTLAFHRRFRAIRQAEPALARFSDPPALFDTLHGPEGDPEVRNTILRALVRRAQAEAEPATTLLLLALWPGLDARSRRLARHFRGESDVLASEITARTVAGILGLDLTRVNRIAATLIRNVERDIIGSLRKAGAEASRRSDIADQELRPPDRAPSVLGLPADLDPEAAAARLVDRLRPAIGDDAHLVVAIAVVGEHQRDATEALGLGQEAGRKRYQRALKQLHVLIENL